MASFPALKTGAVAQYPSDRTRRFSTQVLRFLDGGEQRFAGFSAPLKRWLIRLELLDESELAGIEDFFVEQGGQAGTFTFTDPWDGTVHTNCSFEVDTMKADYRGRGNGVTSVVVKENR
jgi:phage-related protein